jgi:hypothetical protein
MIASSKVPRSATAASRAALVYSRMSKGRDVSAVFVFANLALMRSATAVPVRFA